MCIVLCVRSCMCGLLVVFLRWLPIQAGQQVLLAPGVWERRVKHVEEGLAPGEVAIVVEGPDEDGDFKLSNANGVVVGGEDWIPFSLTELWHMRTR